jgi:hypothetical protein
VATEKNGTWSDAIEVPGTAALNTQHEAEVTAVSCAPGTPGYCTAVGYYSSKAVGQQGFVVTETNGTWGTASAIPGLAALNKGNEAELTALSCAAAANCAAAAGRRIPPGRPAIKRLRRDMRRHST